MIIKKERKISYYINSIQVIIKHHKNIYQIHDTSGETLQITIPYLEVTL